MSDERTRLRVKLGAAEIEYEGNCQFLKDEIMPTVDKILEMVEPRAELQRPMPTLQIDNATEVLSSTTITDVSHSTNTIATLLGAKSANDLAIAAAAHLTLVQKKERMSRQDIIEEMKSAPSFFKSAHVNNLSNTLKTLVKADRLRLLAANIYGLSLKERSDLEKRLAEAQ
jgi:hypothetical protein